jgi:transcription initiation factor TFIIB
MRSPNTGSTERREAGERTTDADAREGACPECGGAVVRDRERGERICEGCGLVVDADEIDRGPEWRAYDAGERAERSRVGAPTTNTMHDRGLSTEIGWRDVDASGSRLGERKRQRMRRLRRWNERFRARDAHERNLKHALGEIDRMASALGVPDPTRETASVIYRRALSADLLPGRSIEGVATSALYAATREAGIPRSVDELTAVSRVEALEITRTYRYLVRELELSIAPPDPLDYLDRFASRLDLSDDTAMQARALLEAGKRAGVHSGRHPVGLVASAIYAAATLTDVELTQSTVSEATDVSEVTIRNRYRELVEAADREAG